MFNFAAIKDYGVFSLVFSQSEKVDDLSRLHIMNQFTVMAGKSVSSQIYHVKRLMHITPDEIAKLYAFLKLKKIIFESR